MVGRGRPQSEFDHTAVFTACRDNDVAVEINCRPERKDPPRDLLKQAVDIGCRFSIDTDAHAPGQLEWQYIGCDRAAECGVTTDRVINTVPGRDLVELERVASLGWSGRGAGTTKEAAVQLSGKTALVTGGAGGIGAATAAQLSSAGALVVVADLNAAAASACAAGLPGPALGRELDVTRPDAIAALVAQLEAEVGGIDLLVNNAGLYDMEPLLDVTPAGFDRLFNVNARGLFFVMQSVAQAMVAAGRPGAIVNVASQAGRRGEAASAVYAATKAAVISLTRSAALALIAHDIRVNAVAPGVVDTPMWTVVDRLHAETTGAAPGETLRQAVEAIPAHRMGTPDEIASAIVFLLTDASQYIVGQTLNVDGGTILS